MLTWCRAERDNLSHLSRWVYVVETRLFVVQTFHSLCHFSRCQGDQGSQGQVFSPGPCPSFVLTLGPHVHILAVLVLKTAMDWIVYQHPPKLVHQSWTPRVTVEREVTEVKWGHRVGSLPHRTSALLMGGDVSARWKTQYGNCACKPGRVPSRNRTCRHLDRGLSAPSKCLLGIAPLPPPWSLVWQLEQIRTKVIWVVSNLD